MLQTERRRQIVELVQQRGEVSVTDICKKFGVSDMTVRRDLRELDRAGLLRRVHGGAVNNLGRSYEPPYQIRSTRNIEAKEMIGREAADMIMDGDSIALDIGTTTLEIARSLQGKRNLTIVTSSVPIANEIISNFSLTSDVRLILTGGIIRPGELSLIGPIAAQTYRELHVDKAFIGIGGISLDAGLTEYNLEDALVKKPMLKSAHQKIVVADNTKLGRTTFANVGSLESIDTVITDIDARDDFVEELRKLGIQVLIAS